MKLTKFIILFLLFGMVFDAIRLSIAKAEQVSDCRALNPKEEISLHERAFSTSVKGLGSKDMGCSERVRSGFLAYQNELKRLVSSERIRLDHFLLVRFTERRSDKSCQKGHYQYGLVETSEWQRSQADEWNARNKSRFVTVAFSFSSENPGFLFVNKQAKNIQMRIEKLGRENFVSNCAERDLSSATK